MEVDAGSRNAYHRGYFASIFPALFGYRARKDGSGGEAVGEILFTAGNYSIPSNGPWIFPWFLGSGWEQSGLIGRALVPWLFLNVATSPISTVFVVTERQQEMLGFAVVYMSTGRGSVWGFAKLGAGIVATVWGLSLFMSLALVGMILLTIRAARIYDREGTTK